jgi:hypothetical protein
LGSALCVELVVTLRQGALPHDDGGTACVVRWPQPVYVPRVALLDDAGAP